MPDPERQRIILKHDWDASTNLPIPGEPPRGYFAGRQHELATLTSDIVRRPNGAILVAGHRGVGKTSLVHKAVSNAQTTKGIALIPVLISAAQLEPQIDPKAGDPRPLLEALIRRLYATTRSMSNLPEPIQAQIASLYRRAAAADFRLVEKFTSLQEHRTEETESKAISQSFDVGKWIGIVVTTCLASAALFQWQPWTAEGVWRKAIPLLLAVPIPYFATIAIKKLTRRFAAASTSVAAEELYEFDNRVGNLEYDLERVHREATKKGCKLVYVIDELDKLDPTHVQSVLRACKNLFTLSDALFIFIGAEELFELGQAKRRERAYERPREYTYFNAKYFISPATSSDLAAFFSKLVDSRTCSDETFDILSRAIFFEAQNDYFDLLSSIRGRVTSYEGISPCIDVSPELGPDQIRSRLYRCVSTLFEDKYMARSLLLWRENSKLIERLFDEANKLVAAPTGHAVEDPQDASSAGQIVRDFHRVLYRCGALKKSSEEEKKISGAAVAIAKYSYVGSIPADPPARLFHQTEYENLFQQRYYNFALRIAAILSARSVLLGERVRSIEDVLRDLDEIGGLISSLGFEVKSSLRRLKGLYLKVRDSSPPYAESREDFEQASKAIGDSELQLFKALPTVTAHLVAEAFPDLSPNIGGDLSSLPASTNLDAGAKRELQKMGTVWLALQDCSFAFLFLSLHLDKLRIAQRIGPDNKGLRFTQFVDATASDIEDHPAVIPWKEADLFGERYGRLLKYLQDRVRDGLRDFRKEQSSGNP